MLLHKGSEQLPFIKNPVLTIGTFDGVHVGHTKIIERLLNKAQEVGGKSCVLTFEPHPRLVLGSTIHQVKLLTDLDEKIEALRRLQIDHLIIVPFTKSFSSLSADEYIRDFLVARFHPHTLIIGYDHHFGHDRKGNFQWLEQYKEKYHYQLEEIPVQELEQIAVSSTKIRQALLEGNINLANSLLGRPYRLQGKVIEGDKRGRLMGFPTANLSPNEVHKLIPANGVYAVQVLFEATVYWGMMNIGIRPTIETSHRVSIEVHLLHFDSDLYGKELKIDMIHRIRDEQKFSNVEELIQQINKDKERTRELFG